MEEEYGWEDTLSAPEVGAKAHAARLHPGEGRKGSLAKRPHPPEKAHSSLPLYPSPTPNLEVSEGPRKPEPH